MTDLISSFFGGRERPREPASPLPAEKPKEGADERRGRKAQLIALKATGAGGLMGEENIGRRKILV